MTSSWMLSGMVSDWLSGGIIQITRFLNNGEVWNLKREKIAERDVMRDSTLSVELMICIQTSLFVGHTCAEAT